MEIYQWYEYLFNTIALVPKYLVNPDKMFTHYHNIAM
jgi:hypothetical protein